MNFFKMLWIPLLPWASQNLGTSLSIDFTRQHNKSLAMFEKKTFLSFIILYKPKNRNKKIVHYFRVYVFLKLCCVIFRIFRKPESGLFKKLIEALPVFSVNVAYNFIWIWFTYKDLSEPLKTPHYPNLLILKLPIPSKQLWWKPPDLLKYIRMLALPTFLPTIVVR